MTSPTSVVGRRPSSVREQLPYLQRAVSWRPILGAAAVATLLTRTDVPPVLVIAALASGLSYVLDDPAAVILDATPWGRPRRRVLRLGLTIPVAGLLWLAVVEPVWSTRPAAPAAAPAGLALAAVVAVVLAAAAIGGGVAGAPVALGVAIIGSHLPEAWSLPVAPGAARNWLILLAVAVLVLFITSRDPAAATRRRR